MVDKELEDFPELPGNVVDTDEFYTRRSGVGYRASSAKITDDLKTILNGTGAPSPSLGKDGEYYIDNAATRLYGPKTAGAWGSGVFLVGPSGAGTGDMLASVFDPTGKNGDAFDMTLMTEGPDAKVLTASERTDIANTKPVLSINDPTVGDDSDDGYVIGSHWVNTSTDEQFVCTDTTVGAAVWKNTTEVQYPYNIERYGADPLGTAASNQTAIQAAIDAAFAAGGGVVEVPVGAFTTNGITGKTNVKIWSRNKANCILKLGATQNTNLITFEAGSTNFSVENVGLDGNRTAQTGTTGAPIQCNPGCTDFVIRNNRVFDAKDNGISLSGCDHFTITENEVDGTDEGNGIELAGTGTSTFGVVTDNVVKNTQKANIAFTSICEHITIADNVCDGNNAGAGSDFADNITGYNAANRQILIKGNICNGSANHGIHPGGEHVSVVGNAIKISAPANNGAGIWFEAAASAQSNYATIADNLIEYIGAVTGNAIFIKNTDRFSCTGNTTLGGLRGLVVTDSTGGSISSNAFHDANNDGVLVDSSSSNIAVDGNAVSQSGGQGIQLANTAQNIAVTNNQVDGAASHAIQLTDTVSNCLISGNHVSAAAGLDIASSSSNDDTNVYKNNFTDVMFGGTITSAATLTFTTSGDNAQAEYFNVVGTTTITAITASWAGRRVTLRFADVLTVVDGGVLVLKGDFVSAANDTLTLVCNGVNWIEVSRTGGDIAATSFTSGVSKMMEVSGNAHWYFNSPTNTDYMRWINASSLLQLNIDGVTNYQWDATSINCGVANRNQLGTNAVPFAEAHATRIQVGGAGGPTVSAGTGVPVTAEPNGSVFFRTDGGSGTTLYVRESGAWVANS